MLVAHIEFTNGEIVTMYANNHVELFARLDASQLDEIKTKPIKLRDMRQGKEKKEEPET